MSIEASFGDNTIGIHPQIDLNMVTTQRIIVRKRNIMRIQFSTIGWVFIVLDDYFTIEIVHTFSNFMCQEPRIRL